MTRTKIEYEIAPGVKIAFTVVRTTEPPVLEIKDKDGQPKDGENEERSSTTILLSEEY